MRRTLSRLFTSTASSTLLRMAKKTSELTSQVLPNRSAKVVRLYRLLFIMLSCIFLAESSV